MDFEKQPVRLPARQQEGPSPEAAGFWLAARVLCVVIATSLPTYRTYENLLKLVQFCFVFFLFTASPRTFQSETGRGGV